MLKVLIVEDEQVIRKGLEIAIDWLKLESVVVGTAENAREGIILIEEKKPDVVLTDICMPGMSGLEMIEEARKKREFYSIVLTGYSEFSYAKQALRSGVTDYLLKPVDEDELKEALDKIRKQIQKNKEYKNIQEVTKKSIYTEVKEWKLFEMAEESVDFYVKKAYEIIKERYKEKLSICMIAEELGVSSSFLSRRIKNGLSSTFGDVLNQYRVKQAIHLLKKGDMRVYEISDELGFSEYKYFCSVFKKYTGATPTEFVKNGGSQVIVLNDKIDKRENEID